MATAALLREGFSALAADFFVLDETACFLATTAFFFSAACAAGAAKETLNAVKANT
nr:hypothetical protein [Diaphorobacter ruginosibacter]